MPGDNVDYKLSFQQRYKIESTKRKSKHFCCMFFFEIRTKTEFALVNAE